MKISNVFFIFFLCRGLAGATSPIEKFEKILPGLLQSDEFAQYVQKLAVSSLPATLNSIRQHVQNGLGFGKAPIVPPLPEQIPLPDGNLTLNLPDLYIDIALWNQTINDLSTLEDALDIQIACDPIIGLSAAFDINLPSLFLRGDQILNLALGADNITGNGKYHIGIQNTTFDMDFIISFIHGAPDKLQISHVDLNVLIGKLDLFAENFVIGGYPIEGDEWEAISENLKNISNSVWPLIKKPVENAVTDIVNGIIKDCGIVDYLAFVLGTGDLTCLNLPTIPASSKQSSPLVPYFQLLTTATEFLEDALPRMHEFPTAQNLAKLFLTSIFRQRNPKDPVFPDFPDPAHPDDFVLPIDLGFLLANISTQDNMIVGLSTIEEDLAVGVSLTPFGVRANFTLSAPGQTVTVEMNGTHTSQFDLNLSPISPMLLLKSSGQFTAGIKDAFLRLGLLVGLQPNSLIKIEIKQFDLSMGFDHLMLYAHKVWAGDCLELPVYWEGIENFVKQIFEILWANNPYQDIVLDYVKQVLNSVIKDCTIANILDFINGGGDLSCLSTPVFPPLPTIPPRTTITTVPTTPGDDTTTTTLAPTTTPGDNPNPTTTTLVPTTTPGDNPNPTTTTPDSSGPTTTANLPSTTGAGHDLSASLVSVLVICFLTALN